jgi:hypothetical protein
VEKVRIQSQHPSGSSREMSVETRNRRDPNRVPLEQNFTADTRNVRPVDRVCFSGQRPHNGCV